MMETLGVISILVNVLLTLGGLMLKAHTDRVRDEAALAKKSAVLVEERVRQVEINYVHKHDLRELKEELMQRFDRIDDKLEKRNT